MTIDTLLYLTQLEEFNLTRIQNWLTANPHKNIPQIKKKLVRTLKIKLLTFLLKSLSLFTSPSSALFLALKIIRPLDVIFKKIFVFLAKLKLILFHSHLTTIVITGSWGKTTLKENLFNLFQSYFTTQATIANQNTLLGISRKIITLPANTQIFIVEAGAYQPGDIQAICRLVKPQHGIITAIGPMHLERFGTLKNILQTKLELANCLPSAGHLWLPQNIKTSKTQNVHHFNDINNAYPEILHLFNLPLPENFQPLVANHRQQITQTGSITIIDDSYNSNPVGFEIALNKLKKIKSKNKILVTPGMIELGHLQFSENHRLAKLASIICQQAIIVGQTNRQALSSGFRKSNTKVHHATSLLAAQEILSQITTPRSVILFENDLPDHYF
jgi:UDP-N-acetylmuramoyl-tripeptide--D-alanyl-D-alanine ligase